VALLSINVKSIILATYQLSSTAEEYVFCKNMSHVLFARITLQLSVPDISPRLVYHWRALKIQISARESQRCDLCTEALSNRNAAARGSKDIGHQGSNYFYREDGGARTFVLRKEKLWETAGSRKFESFHLNHLSADLFSPGFDRTRSVTQKNHLN
jgi:hypothetical protein